MEECKYGCGEEGLYTLKNGETCCTQYSTQCIVNRNKNGKNLKKAYKDGLRLYRGFTDEHRVKSHKSLINNLKDKPFHLWGKKLIRDTILFEQNEKCQICGITNWNGKNLVLEVDHINGNHGDNERNNLRALCPNCHSQTDTYRGKNIDREKEKITDTDLINGLIKNDGNISLTLRELKLTPKGGNHIRAKALINYDRKLKTVKTILENKTKKPIKINKVEKVKKMCECGVHIKPRSKRCEKCWAYEQRKVNRPPYEQLIDEINSTSYSAVGRKHGVSDNTIRKWVRGRVLT